MMRNCLTSKPLKTAGSRFDFCLSFGSYVGQVDISFTHEDETLRRGNYQKVF